MEIETERELNIIKAMEWDTGDKIEKDEKYWKLGFRLGSPIIIEDYASNW